MTTTPTADDDLDRISAAADQARALLAAIETARDTQPERLAKARAEADQAADWARIEEPWDTQWSAIPGFNSRGEVSGMLALPNPTAKELFGSRLCFDLIDCGDDDEKINAVLGQYFSMVGGDTGHAFLLFSSALCTAAQLVIPQLLDEIETRASNYEIRVMLAEARAKAWNGRVSEINRHREQDDDSEPGR
jgi:hypothetical protein